MAITSASKTVVGIYDDISSAKNAVQELEKAGFSRDEVSLVANKLVANTDSGVTETEAHVAADAGIGAALGGVGGLLLSLVALAIPGIGPVLAMGPIVAALGGAGIGAVAGGVIGALTGQGVPEEEAHQYAEGVRRGQVLVTVRTEESRAEHAREVLDAHGAVNVDERAAAWRNRGWTGQHAGAEPLSADELRREREYYSASEQQRGEWEKEERQQRPTGSAPEGGTLEGTRWPHPEAETIGTSLAASEASKAELEAKRLASRVYDATTR